MNRDALVALREAILKALDAVNAALGEQHAQSALQSNILRLPQVLQLTGVSRSFIYYSIKNGKFPAPVPLGARAVGWHEHQIQQWIRERKHG